MKLSTAVVAMVMVFMVACVSNDSQIIGRWHTVNGTQDLQFFKGGTVTVSDSGLFTTSITGDYRFIDDNHIRLDVPNVFGIKTTEIYEVRISGDRLSLRDKAGAETFYDRRR